MKKLTLFCIPRDFYGLFATIQINAIRSWLDLPVDIVLCGQAAGINTISKRFKIRVIPHVKTNAWKTPLLNDVIHQVRISVLTDWVGYINCDIILLSNFEKALTAITLPKFILCGQRRSLPITHELNTSGDWEKVLLSNTTLPIMGSSDYFIFPRTLQLTMPPFAVGRLYWDKWFFYYAKKNSIPIIDATRQVTAIHQQHYPGRNQHGLKVSVFGQEGQENLRLIGGKINCFTIFDSDYVIEKGNLIHKPLTLFSFIRNGEIRLILASEKYPLLKLPLYLLEGLRLFITFARKFWESLTIGK